jgi:hypothetical protein
MVAARSNVTRKRSQPTFVLREGFAAEPGRRPRSPRRWSQSAGVSGEYFSDLARRTAELLSDPGRSVTMATAATERAEYFGYDAFRPRLFELVESLLA